ncbi:sulfate adenylyltransferase subunit CysN [Amphiplicatus metriothermophilus]|uniref:Multifunctional fusion protein n=1 Tax=Amphiplicatus metriothermophilus TaxID=1519374 RepID=A0A239PY74_9PROT|nr:sulfate adenylyltransferase subunit CysN [Amphiplicatus metriothermophilus]MBB5519752.1 bifunctional enzyme CysN/CysC [Amphiplicatus metriothermophilus]SNT75259.1 bifunctional enzyme CysN/CysC [Amphiplicatus metriothermophilus]
MARDDALAREDILAYLDAHEKKSLLRFITCGSVDDGKSTLIGRLLYDSKLIYEDQLKALEGDSRRFGTQGEKIDFALLVDGLAAEREQGITIDVAYRFFSTEKRKFIVADTPGHEQYTRNMATGASTADLAVILVDARKGVLTQTRRHSYIVSLLGIRHVVVAVNKMDLVGYSRETFDEIEAEYRAFAAPLGFESIVCIPISALEGDNVTAKSARTPWHKGPALLPYLETVETAQNRAGAPFRLPVQWVNRPDQNFRGFAGTIASGTVGVGDEVVVVPSGRRSTVARVLVGDREVARAGPDEAVTVTLADEIDISRGDVICAGRAPAEQTDQFAAHILWMHDEAMIPGRQYLLKTANRVTPATVTELKHKVNVNTLEHLSGKTLELNEVGYGNVATSHPIAFDSYRNNRTTGAFVLIDRRSNNTVGAGMIDFSLRRAQNVHWQDLDIHKAERARAKHQRPCILWFTGLSGSGKSTVANLVEKRLHDMGRHTYTLDGDNVRHGLNKDLGFTDADRVENIRRVAETAKLMVDAGLIVLVSFISPFASERRMARELVEDGEFLEVYVSTPLEVCEKRDIKGLYAKARRGEIKNFTGIDSPYEPPENPELDLDTSKIAAHEAAERVVEYLERNGYLRG